MATELEFDVLDKAQVEEALKPLEGWEYDAPAICKTYSFPNFLHGIAFVNRVALVAEHINHHPDIEIHYKDVTVRIWTHKKNATTKADITLAAEIEKVVE